MKDYIGSALDRIDKFKLTKPKTYKLIFIGLCIIAPIEMLGLYLTKQAYLKLRERNA